MIIGLDVETYKWNEEKQVYEPILDTREFLIGYAETDEGEEVFFYNQEEMYQWVKNKIEHNIRKKRRTYIYGHNTEYDWYSIAKNHLLDNHNIHVNFNPLIVIHQEKGMVLDTTSFFKMSLEELGEMLGYKKLEMPKQVKTADELKEYVQRDVKITIKAIMTLKEKLGNLGYKPRKLMTAGQVAMTCFFTYCKKNWLIKSFTEYNEEKKTYQIVKTEYSKEIREALRGGDNHAYKTGKWKNCTMIDVNGMYADMMRKLEFPNLLTEIKNEKIEVGMLELYINKLIGIAKVTIRSPNNEIAFLPITTKNEKGDEIQIHPKNCEMTGTWTYQELKKAVEEGYEILECHWTIRWQKAMINPLKNFIEELYEIEKNCKTKQEKIPIKLIRNNLYGKFAQNQKIKEYKIVTREESIDYVEKGYKTISRFNDNYIMMKEKGNYEPKYVNPIITTLITADARIVLHEAKKKIPYKDLLYCDTDSLIFKGNHLDKFRIGIELGEWKIEEQNEDCKILGEKKYYIGKQVKISGAGRRERTKENIEEERDVETNRMFGLAQAYKTGKFDEVGSFTKIKIEMKEHKKDDIKYESKIRDVKESD